MATFIYLIIIGTSIWVLIDAEMIGAKRGLIKGLGNLEPVEWFIASLLIWIIAFPFYLTKRDSLKKINFENKNAISKIQFNFINWNIGGKIICICTFIAIISMFLKWADILYAQNSFSQRTFFYLVFYVYPILAVLQNRPYYKKWGLVFPVIAIVFSVFYIATTKGISLIYGIEIFAASTGAYVFMLSSIGLLIGVIKYRTIDCNDEQISSSDTVEAVTKAAFDGVKNIATSVSKTFTQYAGAESPEEKITKLKKMLEQGLITEDDFINKKKDILSKM